MSRLCRLRNKYHGEDGQWAYEEITKLREQVAAQAAVIEKLREALTACVCAMQDHQAGIGITEIFDKSEALGRKILATPTDSTQILTEVRRAEREKVIEKCIELGAIERDGVFADEIRSME